MNSIHFDSISICVVITSCIFKQLKKLGDQYSGAALMGKRLQRIVCPHEGDEEGVSAEECILTIASKSVNVEGI